MMSNDLYQAAQELAALLAEKTTRIVFAESCTAGLVSAALAQSPGVSQWHCGSAVTYRDATKTAWLAIPPAMIERHGAVSEEVAQRMAAGALQFTPEAEISAAVTGHLGPNAPAELDGVIFIAVCRREEKREGKEVSIVASARRKLAASERILRQQEAALAVLRHVSGALQQ